MPAKITDAEGKAVGYIAADLIAGEETDAITVNVHPAAGDKLRASADARAAILARKTGTADPLTDLAAFPVDLSEFAGLTVQFDLVIRAAGDIVGRERVALFVGVTYMTPADI
jgi:hypothetical protein